MIDSVLQGLELVLEWPAIGLLGLGCLIGIWLGAVPGLGGIIGLVVMLPFTYGMDPVPAFALLLGMYAVTATSDTIASVMLGIPGTVASQATILDGHPLAQQGQAARAFGAAYTVSAFGGVVGALVLALSLPVVKPVILAFGSPEFFMLGVLGLTMVGSLSGGSILKGLAVALLGLLIAMIGPPNMAEHPRYFFDSLYMIDGLPIIPVVLGLFAIPELMELAIRNVNIARVPREQARGGMRDGILDAVRHWWLALRCALIGSYIGMLPGVGAAIVDWLAYGHAVQSAKDKSRFGQGDIRGVIAPETANNATRGTALIPTVAFGIPGNLPTAILLGALLIVGLRPGVDMLTTQLHVTFSLVWMIVLANIFVAGLLMLWTRQIAKLAFVDGHLIVPGCIMFVLMGSWLAGSSIGDWITCLSFGALGFVLKRGGWPRPPMILAVILGPLLEDSFSLSVQAMDYDWLARPIVVTVGVLALVTVVLAARGILRNLGTGPATGEGTERNPVISFPFSLALPALFVWAAAEALPWPVEVRQFPLTIAVPGIALVALTLIRDGRALRAALREAGAAAACRAGAAQAALGRAGAFFGWLLGVLAFAVLVDQMAAIALFIVFYVRRWGGYRWRTALLYGAGGLAVLYLFYDRTMHLLWHQSVLAELLRG